MSAPPVAQIRAASPADAPALHSMMQALARLEQALPALRSDAAALARALGAQPPACHALIAEVDGRPCGYLSYTLGHSSSRAAAPTLLLDDLYVAPDQRSLGTGSALMAAAMRIAAERGCHQMRWTVETANTRAMAFYRRLGAQVAVRGVCTLAVPPPTAIPAGLA